MKNPFIAIAAASVFLGATLVTPVSAEFLASWEFPSTGSVSSPIAGVVGLPGGIPIPVPEVALSSAGTSLAFVTSGSDTWIEMVNSSIAQQQYLQFELTNLPSGLTDLTFDMSMWREHGNSALVTGFQISTQDRDTGIWSSFTTISGFALPADSTGDQQVSGLVLADASTVSAIQFRTILTATNTQGANASRQIRFTDPEFTGAVIPEPSTYALIFGVFALIGASAVRRRKLVQPKA